MKTYTIETTYRVPNYRQRTHSADTVEDACRLAIADEDWTGALPDLETAGETYVTGAWARRRCCLFRAGGRRSRGVW